MVRLAEARARLDLETEVTPSHVKEAARLLKKSIVHVENRDVDLDDDIDAEAEYGIEGHGGNDDGNDGDDPNGGAGKGRKVVGSSKFESSQQQKKAAVVAEAEERKEGDSAPEPMDTEDNAANGESAEEPAAGKAKVTLSFTEYQRLTLLLVRFMRARETAANPSMSWSTLVNEFIGTAAGGEAPDTEADLIAQTRTLELVIHRLIKVDHILLLLRRSKDKAKRMLKVHPNFTGESMDAGGVEEEGRLYIPSDEAEIVPGEQELEAKTAIHDLQAARAEAETEEAAPAADQPQPMEEEEPAPSTPLARRASSSKAATPKVATPTSGRSARSMK